MSKCGRRRYGPSHPPSPHAHRRLGTTLGVAENGEQLPGATPCTCWISPIPCHVMANTGQLRTQQIIAMSPQRGFDQLRRSGSVSGWMCSRVRQHETAVLLQRDALRQ
jgi:hypothetical protein